MAIDTITPGDAAGTPDVSNVRPLFGASPSTEAAANAAVVAQCEQLLQWARDRKLTAVAFVGFTPQGHYTFDLIGEVHASVALLGATALWEHTKAHAIRGE